MRVLTLWIVRRHSVEIWDQVEPLGRVISVKMVFRRVSK